MPPIIAVGGLGGSGTRAVAEIIQKAGIFIGDDLNESLDNLLFTRLFKNKVWADQATEKETQKRISIFVKVMRGMKLKPLEILAIRNAFKTNSTYPSDSTTTKNFMFNQLFFREPQRTGRWGWKEPNTHIFLYQLLDQIEELKYVHVLRHGLDMAFANNLQQLHNWGAMFGLQVNSTDTAHDLAKKQLSYWVWSTNRIIELKELHPNRIKILRLEELVEAPKSEIQELLDFMQLSVQDELLNELSQIPQTTSSFERYKEQDLSTFSKPLLKSVEALGYSIPI